MDGDLGQPIAFGRTAEIYAWQEGQVLKLFHSGFALEDIEQEARIAGAMHASGLPVPSVGEIVRVNGRNGLVYQRVEGESMWESGRAGEWESGRRGEWESGRWGDGEEGMESDMVRDPKHVVVVSGLIRNAAGEALMIQSPERGWEVPGGRVEEGEDLIQALKREILEESGVKAEIGALVGVYSRIMPPYMILLGFTGRYQSGELTTSEESVAVEWVKPEDVLGRISHPAIRDRVQDLLAGDGRVVYRSYSLDPYRIHDQYDLEDKR